MNNKLTFYNVQPKYFKDHSGSGTGDLIGLSHKMDYFAYLGVDAIILSNLIATQPEDLRKDYKMITKGVGSISDLQRIISIAKNKKIKVILDLNIGSIDETHNWFNAASSGNSSFEEIIDFKHDNSTRLLNDRYKYKYNEKTKSYYVVDTKTHEINLNWSSKETMKKFLEVIKFWYKLGVSGFSLTNFERINNDQDELMSNPTVSELRKLYLGIKRINNNIIVIGKTNILIPSLLSKFTQGESKLFDYTQMNGIARLGTSEKFGADVIGNFSQTKFVNTMKKHVGTKNDIITFGSLDFGRITSRWGDEGQYVSESAKTLGMLLLSSPSPASIYYGDELGTKNIGLTKLEDFLDATINERKRSLADFYGISEKRFMEAQILQNTINAKSLMAWNANANGGFSNSSKTITPISESYRTINVEAQFKDEHSPLNFYKKLISLSKNSELSEILNSSSYKIKVQKLGGGVIQVVRNTNNAQLCFYINLSNKEKSIKIINSNYLPKESKGRVILSTYGYKKYPSVPKKLQPFESILVLRSASGFSSNLQDSQKKSFSNQKQLNNSNKQLNKNMHFNNNWQNYNGTQNNQFNRNGKNHNRNQNRQFNRNDQNAQFKKAVKPVLHRVSRPQKIEALKRYILELKLEKQRVMFELRSNHSAKVMDKKMNSLETFKPSQNSNNNGKPNNNWNQNGRPNQNGKPNNNWNQNGRPNQNGKPKNNWKQNNNNFNQKDKRNVNPNKDLLLDKVAESQIISKKEQKQLRKTQQILMRDPKMLVENNVAISKKEQKQLKKTQQILINKEKLSKQQERQLEKTQEILINKTNPSKQERTQAILKNPPLNHKKKVDESTLTQRISAIKKEKNIAEASSEKLWLNEALEFIRSERKRAAEEERILKAEERAAKAKEKEEYKRKKQEEKNKNK